MNWEILLYNKDNMMLYEGYLRRMESTCDTIEATCLGDCTRVYLPSPSTHITLEVDTGARIVELDETTMKRIAKFNKEKELEEINMKIKDAKKRLKNYEEKLKCESSRLVSLHDAVNKFIDSDFPSVEEYYKDKYCVDEDDYCE